MAKIKFRELEMSLTKAKVYLNGLKTGIIKLDLTEEERKDYTSWEESKKKINAKSIKIHGGDGLFKYLTEQEYLANELSREIKMEEHSRKMKYCEKHGHKEGSAHIASGYGGTRVYAQCTRCGMAYQRGLFQKEWAHHDKVMHTPLR
jgi:hypothetical protein